MFSLLFTGKLNLQFTVVVQQGRAAEPTAPQRAQLCAPATWRCLARVPGPRHPGCAGGHCHAPQPTARPPPSQSAREAVGSPVSALPEEKCDPQRVCTAGAPQPAQTISSCTRRNGPEPGTLQCNPEGLGTGKIISLNKIIQKPSH